jgi:hypothetical protein
MKLAKGTIMLAFTDLLIQINQGNDPATICPFNEYIPMMNPSICHQTCGKYIHKNWGRRLLGKHCHCPCHLYGDKGAEYKLKEMLLKEGYISNEPII